MLSNNATYDLLFVLCILLTLLILYSQYKYTYFKRKGLQTEKTIPIYGNAIKTVMCNQNFGVFWKEMYFLLKAKCIQHGGAYFMTQPFYMPLDLDIVKRILKTDANYFLDRGMYANEETDPLTTHLFSLEGDEWKNLRAKLTPTFTSGKMKMMFNTVIECSDHLSEVVEEHAASGKEIDIRDILLGYTVDVIASCAFGIKCNCLKNPDTEFAVKGKAALDFNLIDLMKAATQFYLPHKLLKFFNFQVTKKGIIKFFMETIRDVVETREKDKIYRKDFLQLLIQLKNGYKDNESIQSDNNGSSNGTITFNQLAGQCFLFFIAGYETSGSTMTFALYELSTRPDLQKKVRDEIESVLAKHNNNLTYDSIKEMKFLAMVVNETLRKYPPIPVLTRKCVKPYTVKNTGYTIEKGDFVAISLLGIHNDPEYYPNPEYFDPERFSEENKATRHQFSWIPFGEGPRICLGLRFGVMQSKIGLITVLRNYNISLSEKTGNPIEIDSYNFLLTPKHGIWIKASKIG